MSNNILNHLNTVHTHRKYVRELCFKCGIPLRGLVHDLSKYSPTEFLQSIKYWTGTKSPNEGEIEDKGYSDAWLHHKGRNKHHPEYWIDPSHAEKNPANAPNKDVDWIFCEMPLVYVAEMFCDRVAANKAYLGDKYHTGAALDYAMSKKDTERKIVNPHTYRLLIQLLRDLKTYGEDTVCKYIKLALMVERRYGLIPRWSGVDNAWVVMSKNSKIPLEGIRGDTFCELMKSVRLVFGIDYLPTKAAIEKYVAKNEARRVVKQ